MFYQVLFLATLEDFELTYSRFDLGKKTAKKNTLRFEMLVVFSVRKTNICLMPLLKLMPFAASRGSQFVLTFFHQITIFLSAENCHLFKPKGQAKGVHRATICGYLIITIKSIITLICKKYGPSKSFVLSSSVLGNPWRFWVDLF